MAEVRSVVMSAVGFISTLPFSGQSGYSSPGLPTQVSQPDWCPFSTFFLFLTGNAFLM